MPLIDQTDQAPPGRIWKDLVPRLTSTRAERLEGAASRRTNHIRLVIQDVHHPHNVSACLRSAEAFGVLNVHVVTMRESFSPSTVARGVTSWLRVHRHVSVADCAAALKSMGYCIALGVPPHSATFTLPEVPVDIPLAIVFGNEKEGVSPEWREHANLLFTIPMEGLVESLNISVSAAVTLFQLTQRAKKTVEPNAYFLPETDRLTLLDEWAKEHLPR